MTNRSICEDSSALVAFLYGECSAEARHAMEAHLAGCARCRAELDGLRGLRVHLAEWAPPEQVLGFRVVRDRQVRRWWRAPAWGLAAAAVLVLAVAAAIARVEVRYDREGLAVRTGWGASDSSERTGAPDETAWRAEMEALEARLRRDLPAVMAQAGATGAAGQAASVDGPALLARVRQQIEASERRQQRELALRITEFARDFDARRRADLSRIQQSMVRLEDVTGAGVAQQQQMLDYLIRVSRRQVP